MAAYILAGDVGGTKTSLSLYSENDGPGHPQENETFPSRDYGSLVDIVADYLSKRDVDIRLASIGVAGPVQDGQVSTTNLPWSLTEASLRPVVKDAPVYLINDLMAAAQAIPSLTPADLHTLNPGRPDPHGAIGLVSPGTGLGEAFLTWQRQGYQAHASEGGHASFAPANDKQLRLLTYLMPKYGHISFERVCSGMGIPGLYEFFKHHEGLPEPDWLIEELSTATDPNPVIFRAATQGGIEIAVKTLELFVDILANEASNLALKVMATGGIYLGGGIPPRLKEWLDPQRFLDHFTHKGRFAEWLADIPIHIILKPETALFGAACFAFEQLRSMQPDAKAGTAAN